MDAGEKVPSGPWNPRFGDEATRFECGWFITQPPDDGVEDLRWDGTRHRDFHQGPR